ncbi:MAG: ATP-binding protein [Halobacteria archaeon]
MGRNGSNAKRRLVVLKELYARAMEREQRAKTAQGRRAWRSVQAWLEEVHFQRGAHRKPGRQRRDPLKPLRKVALIRLPIVGMADVVLPEKTRKRVIELQKVLQRRGEFQSLGFGNLQAKSMTALFSGPSGTGKTVTAEALARELNLPFCTVDYSQVEDCYYGETEKKIASLFRTASKAGALLFFDEADAMLSRRTSVGDNDRFQSERGMNGIVNAVLQELDRFRGIAVFSTNWSLNLDPAFERRLQFKIFFDPPGPAERLALWKGLLPEKLALAPDVDLKAVSDRHELTGGQIRNVARSAALKAFLETEAGKPVTLAARHVEEALREELEEGKKAFEFGLSSDLYSFGQPVERGYD